MALQTIGANTLATTIETEDDQKFDLETPDRGQTQTLAKKHWFRSVNFQMVVVGLVAFFGPGLYNALGNLGAGGLASVETYNIATALLFSLLCVTCVWGALAINLVGFPLSLSISACFYCLYGASLYTNSKNGNEWFLILANALCGIGSGVFFATEGAIVVGYPSPADRGRSISFWVLCRNFAPIVGGSILLGLNVSTKGSGSVSLNSYAVFVALMCLCPFVALLLSPPNKVQRRDGTAVVFHKRTFIGEAKASYRCLTSKRVLLLIPIMFTSWFYDSYISNYNALFFSVRTRALSAFLTPFGGNIGSLVVGFFLDSKFKTRRFRASTTFAAIIVFQLALWIWMSINIKDFSETNPTIDWGSPQFGRAYALTFFFNFEGLAFQSFLYWFIGTLSNDLEELVHLTGILRGYEGAGQAVAYGLASSPSASLWIHIGLNVGLVFVSAPLAWLVIRETKEIDDVDSSESRSRA